MSDLPNLPLGYHSPSWFKIMVDTYPNSPFDEHAVEQVRQWLQIRLWDEYARQQKASVGAAIDAELRESLSVPDESVPEHAGDWLKPPEGEAPELPGPSEMERREAIIETINGDEPLSAYARNRAQRADLYVTADGHIWDHKPTWRDRLLRRKPHTTSDSGLWKGK